MTKEEKDLIQRAQDIQRYTENRCNTLEERIAEQEETIDAQDEKINFYVSKMNENILKRQALKKENEELKIDIEIADSQRQLAEKENEELKKELEKEQNLNKVIKERLVEVNCDCNAEKKEKCVMFPEYCEGERKTVVDLMSLVSDGLNESLIKQKDEQIAELKEFAEKLSEQHADEWQKQQEVITELKEQIEKMKCCGNCINHYDLCYCELDRKEVNASNVCNKWEWEKEE